MKTDNFIKPSFQATVASNNDCSVRALATVFNAEYDYIALMLKGLGRQDNKGTYKDYSIRLLDAICKQRSITYTQFNFKILKLNIRTSDFLKTYCTGRYLCSVNRHIFAVIDGVRYDTYCSNELVISGIKLDGDFSQRLCLPSQVTVAETVTGIEF